MKEGGNWNRGARRSGGDRRPHLVMPSEAFTTEPVTITAVSIQCYERRHIDCPGDMIPFATGPCGCKCHAKQSPLTNWFDDLKSGLQAWHIIHYLIGEVDRTVVYFIPLHGSYSQDEAERMMDSALAKVEAELLRKFAKSNPDYPDCIGCLRRSIFGGPNHQASEGCESGKRDHCTCSTCW